MSLVYNDGELPPPVLVANGSQDERKFLDSGNHYLLSLTQQGPEVTGSLGVAHDRTDLRKLPDGIPDLLVQNLPVGDDDDRIE